MVAFIEHGHHVCGRRCAVLLAGLDTVMAGEPGGQPIGPSGEPEAYGR